jgi:hypothetical protein
MPIVISAAGGQQIMEETNNIQNFSIVIVNRVELGYNVMKGSEYFVSL